MPRLRVRVPLELVLSSKTKRSIEKTMSIVDRVWTAAKALHAEIYDDEEIDAVPADPRPPPPARPARRRPDHPGCPLFCRLFFCEQGCRRPN